MENNNNLKKAISLTLDQIKNTPLKKSIKIKHSEITDSSSTNITFKIEARVPKNKEIDLAQFREELYDLLAEEINNDYATEFINQNFSIQIGLSEGDKFTQLEVNDINSAKHIIKKEAGIIYVLDFWATWCKFCQEPMQENIDLMNKDIFKDKNVKIIGISCDEDASKWKTHIKDKNWENIPHYVRTDVRQHLGIKSIPCIMIIDKKGQIVYYGHPGSIKLEETLHNLINDKGIVTGETNEELNSWWIASENKIDIVSKANQSLKSSGSVNANFIVNTKYNYDSQLNRTVRSIPTFFGNISPYENDLLKNVADSLANDFKFEGFNYNITIVNLMDEDF